MQAFIASDDLNRVRDVEPALRGFDCVTLLSFPGPGDDGHGALLRSLEESDLLVADCYGAVTPFTAWLLGAARSAHVPVVAITGPGEHPERSFPALWGTIGVYDSPGEFRDAVRRLWVAMSRGIEETAETVTELHVAFRERLGYGVDRTAEA